MYWPMYETMKDGVVGMCTLVRAHGKLRRAAICGPNNQGMSTNDMRHGTTSRCASLVARFKTSLTVKQPPEFHHRTQLELVIIAS